MNRFRLVFRSTAPKVKGARRSLLARGEAYVVVGMADSDETGALYISHDCASVAEFKCAIRDLKKELDGLVPKAKRAFAAETKRKGEK